MSFRKLDSKSKHSNIKGTQLSLRNSQLLISSGVPSIDHVFGGGFPVGSLILVEEDRFGNYAKLLMKYFLAEGICNEQHVFLAGGDTPPNKLLQELPAVHLKDGGMNPRSNHIEDEALNIAWRYQNMPQAKDSPISNNFSHTFDLSKVMQVSDYQISDKVMHHNILDDHSYNSSQVQMKLNNKILEDLLAQLKCVISKSEFDANKEGSMKNILRIGIHSFCSPLWFKTSDHSANCVSAMRFLYALKSLLRSSLAVCFITFPPHLYQDLTLQSRMNHMCDGVFLLESFVGSKKETNPLYKDYHGLFHIKKIPTINSITHHIPESFDLAFKAKKRSFLVEQLCLPPDLSETASRTQDEPSKQLFLQRTAGCSAIGGAAASKLDF